NVVVSGNNLFSTFGGTNYIDLVSVQGATSFPTNIPIVGYSGAIQGDGNNFGIRARPKGFSGIVSNDTTAHRLVLVLNGGPSGTSPNPSVGKIYPDGQGHLIVTGTNNDVDGGGQYRILASTNVTLPLSQWTAV